MGLVLRGKQCFSHGQVYVAMSRVTTIDGIRIFSPNTCRGDPNYIGNVVYYELLDNSARPIYVNPRMTSITEEQMLIQEEEESDDEYLLN